MRRATLHALAIGATMSAGAIAAAEPNNWVEARGRHFTVVSNAGEEQARATALQFEHVRTTLARVIGGAQVDVREPVIVLAVDNDRELRQVLPQYWERNGQRPVAGYWPGPYRHYIALRVDAPDRERYRRVLHEYVHMLTHVNIADLPAWLDEGLSEFWSTALVEDDGVEIGRPAQHHLKLLHETQRWIPLHELFAMERPPAEDKRKLNLFYAQAWAIVHYLTLGAPSSSLQFIPPGTTALGDLTMLEQKVREYVRDGEFRAVRSASLKGSHYNDDRSDHDSDDVHVRNLSPAQSLAVRATFVLDGERPAAALPLLTEAVKRDPREPTALEALGRLHFQQNQPAEAAAWLDRVIDGGSASHLAYFYRAILAASGAAPLAPGSTNDSPEGLLRRSIDTNSMFAPAYLRLASEYAQDPRRLEEATALLQRATELEPRNRQYRLELEALLARQQP
jgi:tetratricopeptide (TPR) repeat protein